MKEMRKNMHLPDDVVRLIGDVLHSARFRSETQAVIAMLEGASDRLKNSEGYVYLMRGENGFKIGTSIRPHARAKALKSELIFCICGDRLTELSAHMLWGRYRLSKTGEWFAPKQEIYDWFSSHDLLVPLDRVEDGGKKPTNLALDPDILDRVDAWIRSQEMPVTKTWVFEKALSEFLEKRSENKSV